MKQMVNRCKTVEEKHEHRAIYRQLNKAVKYSARKDRQNYSNDLATQAKMAAHRRNMKYLYEITRTLAGKGRNPSIPMKDKEGRTIKKEAEQRSTWEEHLKEILNRDSPAERPDIPIAEMLLTQIYLQRLK